MALWTAGVLALALVVAGMALLAMHSDHERWEKKQKAEGEQVLDRSRKYLADLKHVNLLLSTQTHSRPGLMPTA